MDQALSDLQLRVRKAIQDDPRLRDHSIEVHEENGVITLRGSVPSREAGETTEQIVQEVFGVRGVINQLEPGSGVS